MSLIVRVIGHVNVQRKDRFISHVKQQSYSSMLTAFFHIIVKPPSGLPTSSPLLTSTHEVENASKSLRSNAGRHNSCGINHASSKANMLLALNRPYMYSKLH